MYKNRIRMEGVGREGKEAGKERGGGERDETPQA